MAELGLAVAAAAAEGEMLMLWLPLAPEARERWEDPVTATAAAADRGPGFVLECVVEEALWDVEVGDVDLVVIDRVFEGTATAVVVDEEVETRDDGETDEVVALNVGLGRARNAARKLAKKGRLVDMTSRDGK